ncbi:phage tail tape measure protein [Pseudomonas alliivorans]|uniref:phage tail tape measure protein n=1 Tax=Pseudomonas alliivorans TaxID=2810613 RepID=UPI001AE84F65|nr:phage tail tape measure protein [Pseudomonas alliivorans]MBP0943084.1 phage tail tape measure protein [Pseudomonas alliivorans]MEE4881180.1 phage tail tape measure protein [Pseudomonas alliivorans]MEE4932484.1 phage tail tape measure protein [Pseudomonas alliivorans]MEE4937947.1 phage tail tape measure protein [Pseudomonas alliivorans]MEE4943120.1 phage tail tape measure protein [Pseudomonas alliivorans]
MTHIAELGIRIDSSDAAQAAVDLDKLATAGGRAEKAASGIASGFDNASSSAADLVSAQAKLSETTEQAVSRLTAMAKASLESSDYHQRLTHTVIKNTAAVDASGSSATSLAALRRRLQAESDALVGTTEQLADSTKKAALATTLEAEGLQALLGKINPTIAALDKLDGQQAQLRTYKNAGLIDAETFREYSSRIDASRQKLGDFGETLGKTRSQSVQTEQALRQLPSQFSDIFTSLAGGQDPLLVMIQQGGQIKDSFGGIGPMLDVLGSKIKSVLGIGGTVGSVGDAFQQVGAGAKSAADGAEAAAQGLGVAAENANTAADAAKNAKEGITALSAGASTATRGMLAAAAGVALFATAAGALVIGYSRGTKEADDYNKELILTGNYAGSSADQMATLAKQVAATNGTVAEASASLTLLASSSVVASSSFKRIADAAAAMDDATGKSVESTVAEFIKIAKDPVAAAKALNDQYNFLTASVYAQIVALKEQGNVVGAADLLTKTYADTIESRSKQITDNLGLWQKAWKGIKDAASGALDSINEVGRTATLDEQIADVDRRIAQVGAGGFGLWGDKEKILESLKDQRTFLEDAKAAKADIAEYDAEQTQIQQKAITAEQHLRQISDSNLTNSQKRNKEIEKYLRYVADLKKANPASPLVQPDFIAKTLQNIKDKHKDPAVRAKAVDLTEFNTAQNQLKLLTGYYSAIQKELDASQKTGLVSAESFASQRAAIIEQQKDDVTAAYQAEIVALQAVMAKASTSAEQRVSLDQKIADARSAMVDAQKRADSDLAVLALNETGRLNKQALAVSTYTGALRQQVITLRQQGQRATATLGMGDRERDLSEQKNAVDDRVNQQKIDLANQYGDGARGMSLDEYTLKLAALNKNQQDLHDTVQSNYDAMTVAQGSWSAGASSAFQNYLEAARDVAGQTRSLFTGAFSSMEDSVVNFAMTGKFSFADFTKSILADMARIATRQASSALLGTLFGAATSYFAGGVGDGLASGSAGAVSSTAGASAGGYSDAVLNGWSGVAQANGGAWAAGTQMFASGAAFTNGIVNRPTEFGMAGGQTGLMGEAGPEAIMPLTRTAGGQLGVRALGGGGSSNTYNFPITVSVQTTGESDGSPQQASTQLGKAIQKAAKAEAEASINRALQPGGSIWKLTNGR